ncbi:MAG: DNA repair and recombination protein RadB, partial [Candidatus Thermoplasmatota archaeon]|nr:DNA repair and recombination protein RadB [Candidatus Thermoplasmatota archaeon]
GTGKTNVCLQAARECVLNSKKAAYIDSEGVSIERLRQITKNEDQKNIMKNILIFSPTTQKDQEKMIQNAIRIKDIQLIIVDTLNLFYRLHLDEDKEECMRSFTRQVASLQKAARELDLYVLITEQVFTDKNGEVKPFTNRDVEHLVKTIIKLEKNGIGSRQATIIKHRSQPEGKKASFQIELKGLK